MTQDRPPELLHRYRPAEDFERGRLQEVLLQDKIYAPSPSSFNDPFDCKVRIQPSTDPKEWRRLLQQSLKKLNPDLRFERLRQMVTREMATGLWKRPETLEAIVRDLQAEVDATGVICFCESGTVPLMWSHYASGHCGFCFRFRPLPNTIFYEAQKVTYSLSYPLPPLSAEADEQVEAFLLTKALWWDYEKEWRFIGYRRGSGHRVFPAESLEALILGCRIQAETRSRVLDLVAARPRPVAVFQAEPSRSKFELDLRQLT